MQEDPIIHRLKVRMGGSTVMSSIPRSRAFIPIATWVQITSLNLCFPLFPVSLNEKRLSNGPQSTLRIRGKMG